MARPTAVPPTLSRHFSLRWAGSYPYSPTPLHQTDKTSKQRQAGGGYNTQQQQGGGCTSPTLLGLLAVMGLLLLPLPWRPSALLGLQRLEKVPSTTKCLGTACQCLQHGQKAAGSCLPSCRGCGAGGGLAPLAPPAPSASVGMWVKRPWEEPSHSSGHGNKYLRLHAYRKHRGHWRRRWCGIGPAFCAPLPSTPPKPLLWGLVFILTPWECYWTREAGWDALIFGGGTLWCPFIRWTGLESP